MRRDVRDVRAVQEHLAVRRPFESGDHAQRRRLAAAARTQEREELAARNLQVDAVDRDLLVEDPPEVEQLDPATLSAQGLRCQCLRQLGVRARRLNPTISGHLRLLGRS
jgi:hypothetical protein